MKPGSLIRLSQTPSRGRKRMHDMGFQEISPLPSAFAVYSAQSFGTVPYAAGCDANRSASMDSEASSYSPLPKRHCLRSCQLPDTPDALAHVQSCHWQQHHQQQHASAQPPILSDTQKLYAVKTMLQNSSSQQASTLLAYMQQLQHLRTAAACQTNTAQTVCAQQSSEHHNFAARARKIRHHLVGQQQQHHQQQQMHQPVSGLIHSDAMDFTRAPADSFMHQLPDMQTPVQQQELQASSVPHIDPEAYWQVQHRAAPHSVPYETTQLHAHHLCSQHQLAQPEQLWQSLLHSTQSSAPVSELHNSQTCAAYPVGHFLCVQQQASMLHQLTQAKHACMQHHLAQKQQAYAQRQLATVPRPAMGFAELAGYWAHGLKLQRCESVQLACHLWKRVQQQVSIAYMHLLGAEKPWETMLLGCLWLAAKLEECRCGVPTASKVGALLGVDSIVMGGVELYLMQLVSWAPLLEWKDRRLPLEDDSWY
ncbi:TPA: hypothetical protein ACH3X3_014246 [Trebouxia sp. C0006]